MIYIVKIFDFWMIIMSSLVTGLITLSSPIFGNTLKQYLFFIVMIIIGFISTKVIVWVTKHILLSLAKKTKNKLDDIIVSILERPRPFQLIVVTIFFNIGFRYLIVSDGLKNVVTKLSFVIYVLGISLFVIKFILGLIKEYIEVYTAKTDSKYDDQIIPLLKTLTKIIIFIFAILIILANFGYNISVLIAGLGIGGIAIAFAARDMLENFISGIMIFSEKPFKVGDLVKTTEVNGTVEEIGIRSTRIRTFDNTLIVVPNSKLSMQAIENYTARNIRRVVMRLGLVYDTSTAKLEKSKQIIKDILKKTTKVTDTQYITFDKFNDYSLDIEVIYYVAEMDYGKYLAIKDKVNFEIKKQFEKEKINFAYPTQTIITKK